MSSVKYTNKNSQTPKKIGLKKNDNPKKKIKETPPTHQSKKGTYVPDILTKTLGKSRTVQLLWEILCWPQTKNIMQHRKGPKEKNLMQEKNSGWPTPILL